MGAQPAVDEAFAQQKNIILATTTSTQDSGLLDVLIPVFEKKTGYFVKTIAVGQARPWLWDRKVKQMCSLFIRRQLEKKFVADGFGINRRLVMHNDFIVAGLADPLKSKESSQVLMYSRRLLLQAIFLYPELTSPNRCKGKRYMEGRGH